MSLTSLVDDVLGDLDGRGDCAASNTAPQILSVGGSYNCSVTATLPPGTTAPQRAAFEPAPTAVPTAVPTVAATAVPVVAADETEGLAFTGSESALPAAIALSSISAGALLLGWLRRRQDQNEKPDVSRGRQTASGWPSRSWSAHSHRAVTRPCRPRLARFHRHAWVPRP